MDLDEEGGFESAIDGPRFAGLVGISIDTPLGDIDGNGSGPRIGGRLHTGYSQRDLSSRRVAGEPLLEIEDYVSLALVAPQVTLSYRQYLSGNTYDGDGLFIEPGIGGGLGFGILSFGSRLDFGNDTLSEDIDDTETSTSYAVQPYLRLGYEGEAAIFGFEGGYLMTGVDFDDDLGQDGTVAYGGLFVGLRIGS